MESSALGPADWRGHGAAADLFLGERASASRVQAKASRRPGARRLAGFCWLVDGQVRAFEPRRSRPGTARDSFVSGLADIFRAHLPRPFSLAEAWSKPLA